MWTTMKPAGGPPPNLFHRRADVECPFRIETDEPKDLAALFGQGPETFFALTQFVGALGDDVLEVFVQPLDAAPGEAEFKQVDDLAGE